MEFKRVRDLMDQILETGIPGCDCAIYYKGEQVFRHAVGYADRETKRPMRPHQKYNFYSAGKVMTVTCAMKLIEDGKMALDDPLAKYMPEFAEMTVKTPDGIVPAKNQITVRDLLRMTAGFNYNVNAPAIKALKEETGGVSPTREFARYLAREPLNFEPGTDWLYSLGHDVLGALIEVASGMTFGSYMKKIIFDVCGMKETGFRHLGDPVVDESYCTQYTFNPKDESIERTDLTAGMANIGTAFESGGGGITSTVEDYCLFQEGLIAGKILKPETLALMQTPQLDDVQQKGFEKWLNIQGLYTYGLGVRLVKPDGKIAVPEFGWGGMAGVLTMMDTTNRVTMCYAQHVRGSGGSKAEPLRARIKEAAYEGLGISWWKK